MNLHRISVVMLIGLCLSVGSLQAAKPSEWSLSNQLTVDVTEFGGITKVTDGNKLVMGSSQIFVHKPGKEGVLFQGSGFVSGNTADIKRSDEEVVSHGTLLMDKAATAAKAVDYTVTYKKVSDGVMLIRAELTYLTDSSWSIPGQFSLSFPFAQYADAQFVTLDHESTERTYEVGSNVIKFTGYGFKSATLSKGTQSVTIEPVGNTTINFQDSRSWGGDYLRIDIGMKQEWKTPFVFKAGTKQSFEAKVTFKSGN